MLKSMETTETGICVHTSGGNFSANEDAQSLHISFTVSPSPCTNVGDHKLPNAYSFTRSFRTEPNGFFQYANWNYSNWHRYEGYLRTYILSNPLIVMDDHSNTVNNKALAKLYEKIRNSDVSLNTTIGEGRETLQMMDAVVRSAGTFIANFKRAKRQAKKSVIDGLRNPLQTVGGLELLWSVGLAPLISDVENIRNHVANKQDPFVEIKVDSRAAMVHEKTQTRGTGGSVVLEQRELEQRIEYGLLYRISDLHAFENWRLGLTVRPTLLWELTTLSFVFDYFVNIGQYLELYEASVLNNGITFHSGYATTSSRDRWWIESEKPWTYEYGMGGTGNKWSHRGVITSKSRTVLTSFPRPNRPTVKLPSAASSLLNCAALLSQLLQRKS